MRLKTVNMRKIISLTKLDWESCNHISNIRKNTSEKLNTIDSITPYTGLCKEGVLMKIYSQFRYCTEHGSATVKNNRILAVSSKYA